MADFFVGSEVSMILLLVSRADDEACSFLLEAQLGVMFVVRGRPLVLLCFEGFSCSDCCSKNDFLKSELSRIAKVTCDDPEFSE